LPYPIEARRDLLALRVRGAWWDVLEELQVTLFVTREYEHLVMALGADHGSAEISYLALPHPSGLAVDRLSGRVYVASTRSPNQIYELCPLQEVLERGDMVVERPLGRPLLPKSSTFFPGALYIHDLAIVSGKLHANAVGMNSVIEVSGSSYRLVWWPNCVDNGSGPLIDKNYIQLNSIAAGDGLENSYFSASTTRVGFRRPGHRNFAVDKRGVVFHGGTREVVVAGLTRPHSARIHNNALWLDNSGYGELVRADGQGSGTAYEVVRRLPGWTRGLCFVGDVAFVGTSKVLPRFRQYAPGLEESGSVCGVHAVDLRSSRVLGSIIWPAGNQIFALEWLPRRVSTGLPYPARGRARDVARPLFYVFNNQSCVDREEI
jgi:uncharacterized protein (TIGR03032 family)